jgi:transposase-like protein
VNKQDITPSNKLTCPNCQLSHIKKNGHTHYGKQNHRCLICGRQFVLRDETFCAKDQELIKKLLLERLSLRGICRVFGVSLCWLLNFIEKLYPANSEDLNLNMSRRGGNRNTSARS